MKGVAWVGVACCVSALACISCADALGLHDLVEEPDVRDPAGDSASLSIDGGLDAAVVNFVPVDADLAEASPPEQSMPLSIQTDAMSIAVGDAAESGAPASVVPTPADAGRESSAPSASPVLDSGARTPEAGLEGGACGASGFTVHSNGIGQTFQDCAPSGTYDATQALEACTAFTGKSASCTIESCIGLLEKATDEQAACSKGASTCECWSFAGVYVGLVQSTDAKLCKPCAAGGKAWN
jgi:hypothetical protein